MSPRVLSRAIVTSLAVFVGGDVLGQCTSRDVERIYEPDGDEGIDFGSDVDLGDQIMAIGARFEGRGAVYAYGPGPYPWGDPQRLPAAGADFFFGNEVSIDGGKIASGAGILDDSGPILIVSDAAYVFRHNGVSWVREQRIIPQGSGLEFGWSVALSGDRLVVGAPSGNRGRGEAYVYSFDGDRWNLDARLRASDGILGDDFGRKVALFGDTVAIGAPRHDGRGSSTGAVYVFQRIDGEWNAVQTLFASDAEQRTRFGRAIAIGEGLMVIGADGPAPRAVYVFEPIGEEWAETEKIFASDGEDVSLGFGKDIDLWGDRMIVSAEASSPSSGGGYIFAREGGRFQERLKLTPFGRFGAISKEWAMTGFPSFHAGKAYQYDARSELRLAVSNDKPAPGDFIGVESFCGRPGGPVFLTVAAIDEVPSFALIVAEHYRDDYRWSEIFQVPGELSGHRIDLQVFGQASDERFVATEIVGVDVQ